MNPRLTQALAGLALTLGLALPAAAGDGGRATIGGDEFVAGQNVRVTEPVAGDLFAAGARVDVEAPVAGDLVVMGGQLRLRQPVGHSVFAGGGQLQIESQVGRNLRIMGGQLELSPLGQVSGNVSAVGGQVRLLGPVKGHVMVAGGDVLIDAAVAGDVTATSGELALGPNARIEGKLRYRSGQALQQAPGAQVAGGVELLLSEVAGGERSRREHRRGLGIGLASVWTLGLMLVAALLVAVLPGLTAGVSRTLRQRTGMSLLLGLGMLVGVPVAIVLLVVTVIGLPLALLALALYLALLPLAYAGAAIALGDGALQRWRTAQAGHRGWRVGAACLALALLVLVGQLPFLGALIGLAALLSGLGALALQIAQPARNVT